MASPPVIPTCSTCPSSRNGDRSATGTCRRQLGRVQFVLCHDPFRRVQQAFWYEWHAGGTAGLRRRRDREITCFPTRTGTSEELDLAEGPKGLMRGPDPQVSAGPGPFCVPSPARQRRTEMNIIDQAVWHGGGTSAPPRRARIGVTPGICGWHAVDVVPERAVEARRAARCARGRSHHRTRRRGDTRTPTPGAVFRSIRRIALAGH